MRHRFAALFRTRTRAEWCALLEDYDMCFVPVLSLDEAPLHKHNLARGTFQELAGVLQPGTAPRLSRTPGGLHRRAPGRGDAGAEIMRDWGVQAGPAD